MLVWLAARMLQRKGSHVGQLQAARCGASYQVNKLADTRTRQVCLYEPYAQQLTACNTCVHRAGACVALNWLGHCRVARQTSVTPSSSRPEATDIESSQRWTSALTWTLQKGIETARQSQREQQHRPVMHSKAGSRTCSLLSSCRGALGSGRCCQTWGQVVPSPEVDEQHLTRAERLSLLTVKAHKYTLQYQQVRRGCLIELADLKCKCNLLCS